MLVAAVTVAVLVVAFLVHRPAADPEAAAASHPVDTVTVGSPAPLFSGTTTTGERIALDQFRGHPVWLSFGATWCAGCRAEAPDVAAAAAQGKAEGLVVVAVYLSEDAERVKAYADLVGADYLHVPDPQKRIAAKYPSPGVPTHYFLDANGIVRDIHVGILTRAQMDAQIARMRS